MHHTKLLKTWPNGVLPRVHIPQLSMYSHVLLSACRTNECEESQKTMRGLLNSPVIIVVPLDADEVKREPQNC